MDQPPDPQKDGLTPTFNELSLPDRLQLKMAVMGHIILQDMHDDLRAHPGKTFLYMGLIAAPVPGSGIAMLAAALAWAKWGWTQGARELRGKLTEAFNNTQAIMKEYAPFIERRQDGKWHLQMRPAMAAMTRQSAYDFKQVASVMWDNIKHVFDNNNPPKPQGPG